jgi:uncharacterized protein YuzE
MDLSVFAVWKFRYVEGYLEGMHASELESTRYVNPDTGEVTWIKYDMKREVATVTSSGNASVECKFSDLEKTLKELNMYRPRAEMQRHSLAGPQNKGI